MPCCASRPLDTYLLTFMILAWTCSFFPYVFYFAPFAPFCSWFTLDFQAFLNPFVKWQKTLPYLLPHSTGKQPLTSGAATSVAGECTRKARMLLLEWQRGVFSLYCIKLIPQVAHIQLQ